MSERDERSKEIVEYDLDLDAAEADAEEAIRSAVEAVEAAADEESEGSGDSATAAPDSSDNLETLGQELADLQDRLLRTVADYENYRKRVQRERQEERRYSGFEVLHELLGVIDNLERALAAPGTVEELKAGVQMILRQLAELLTRAGVERIAAAGERFDPAVHDAVARREDPGIEDPVVLEEHQPGYRMHDRLLRPATVTVAVPAESSQEEGEEAN